ncbi:MAG: hypothetical protein EF813_12515 [Methanosarcinales archaeon]|nr:MAG: hypothetical protein EF813_12515 [Methanosarcinales archaeon]
MADHIIDTGPDDGGSGHVVAAGTPEKIVEADGSYAGRFLGLVPGDRGLMDGFFGIAPTKNDPYQEL